MSTTVCEAPRAAGPGSVTDLNKDAFDALFDAHYVEVLRFVERRVDGDHEAEDIAGEVFALAWAKAGDPPGRAWLYRTASLLLKNHYRRRDRRRLAEQALATLADRPGLGADERLAVATALHRLSDRDREIVQLTYWEGLSAAEVGDVMGTSAAAVLTTLSRARARLRGLLDAGEEAP